MPKTEYVIDDGGLRMEFDCFYSLDEAGNFAELGVIRCTDIFICPRKEFFRAPLCLPAVEADAEREAEKQYTDDIIEQIEGELLAAKHSDAERRREGDR